MLNLNALFKSDIDSKTLNLVPLVRITKGLDVLPEPIIDLYVSTNSIEFDGNYYNPILLNIPSLKESVNFESRKYTISSVDLQLSNFPFEGDRLSDGDDLINSEVEIRWKSQSCQVWGDCLKVFIGKVRNVKTTSDNLVLSVEDVSQENLHRDLPVSKNSSGEYVPDKYKNKPIPIVYGHVDKSPLIFGDFYKTLIADSKNLFEFVQYENDFGQTSHPLYVLTKEHLLNVLKERDGGEVQYDVGNNKIEIKILDLPTIDVDGNVIQSKTQFLECHDSTKNYRATLSNVLEPSLQDKPSSYFDNPPGSLNRISDNSLETNNISWDGFRERDFSNLFFDSLESYLPSSNVILLYDSNDGTLAIDFRTTTRLTINNGNNQDTIGMEDLLLKLGFNFLPKHDYENIGRTYDDEGEIIQDGKPIHLIGLKVNGINLSEILPFNYAASFENPSEQHGDPWGYVIHTNSDQTHDVGGDAISGISRGLGGYGGYHDLMELYNADPVLGAKIYNLIGFDESAPWSSLGNFSNPGADIQVAMQTSLDGNMGISTLNLTGNLSEIDLLRKVQATNVLEEDFYANVKGRWDETGAYTDHAPTTRMGRTGETRVVQRYDVQSLDEIRLSQSITSISVEYEGSYEGDSHIKVTSSRNNSMIIHVFRDQAFHIDNFVSLTFHFKATDEGIYAKWIRIGDTEEMLIEDSSWAVMGKYYRGFYGSTLDPYDRNSYDSEWRSYTYYKEDFLNEDGTLNAKSNPNGTINCFAINTGLYVYDQPFYYDYMTATATAWLTPPNEDDDDTPDDDGTNEDVLGCTDEDADNFNPDANVDDGSCIYDSSPIMEISGFLGNIEENSHYSYGIPGGATNIKHYNTQELESVNLGEDTFPNENNETLVFIDFNNSRSQYNNNEPLDTFESWVAGNIQFSSLQENNIIFNNNANEENGSIVLLTDSENENDNPRIAVMLRAGDIYDQLSFMLLVATLTDNTSNENQFITNIPIAIDEHYPPPVLGCTDATACNYNADATEDDGSCTYPQDGYDCDGNPINWGCQNPNAENYNPDANIGSDEEYCIFADTDGDGVPDYQEIPGCTDPLATNYNQYATDDDGSCEYYQPPDVELGEDADVEIQPETGFDVQLIKNPADIIHHLIKEEIGVERGVNEQEAKGARDYHKFRFFNEGQSEFQPWNFGFTVDKKINSKKLIEEIAKSTKLFPKFRNDGEFGFSYIKDLYSLAHIQSQVGGTQDIKELIKNEDIISYKFSKTPLDQVYTRVKVLYNKDYDDGELKKDTDWLFIEDLFSNQSIIHRDYYGFSEEIEEEGAYKGGQELVFESEYIRHEGTAKALRHFLLGWHKEQHNIVELKLPLSYIGLEIGDTITFNEMIEGIKINGEDYSRNYVLNNKGTHPGEDPLPWYIQRNGQVIYPIWFITETRKNIDSVQIKAIQIHDWTASRPPIMGAINETRVSGANFTITNIRDHFYGGRGELSNNIGKLGKTTFELEHNQEGNYEWTFEGNDLDYTIKSDEDGITKVIFNNATGSYPYHVNVTLNSDIGTATNYIKLYKLGDITKDGGVGLKDVKILNEMLLGSNKFTKDTMFLADIDEDGYVRASDLIDLQEELDVEV